MQLIEAEKLALQLMSEHKLDDWDFKFDKARHRFGMCSYREKCLYLSAILVELNNEEQVRDTILHEIAHAQAGAKAKHGIFWKIRAQALGCNASRCCGDDVITPTKKYTGTCSTCSRTIQRDARRKSLACGKCCRINGGYDQKFKFNWTRN